MPQTANADSDRDDAFTCGALLMCLYLPGLSKKKLEEAGTNRQPTAMEQDQPNEQEPPQHAPSRAVSLEKFECSSLYSGSNIVFDFLVESDEGEERGAGRAVQGYCPSPCFDLPVELIRAGERCGVAASDTPVTASFVFDGYQRGALKKMASCVAGSEARTPHPVRFLSASGSRVPAVPARPPVMSSCGPPNGTAVDGDRESADHARGVIQRPADVPGRETVFCGLLGDAARTTGK